MLTKKQVSEIKPEPFQPVMSYTRFRNGNPVPVTHAAYSSPRPKREWSPEGTHKVKLVDSTTVERPGQYVLKMRRP